MIQKLVNRLKTKSNFSLMDSVAGQLLGKTASSSSYDKYSVYLNRALNKRAEKVGEIEWYIIEGDEEVWDDEWLELLKNPNDSLSKNKFWELYQRYMDLFGEAFIWAVRTNPENTKQVPQELILLEPNEVQPIYSYDGRKRTIKAYSYRGQNFSTDEILYNYNPSPRDLTKPEPIINEGGKRILETERAINEYNAKVMQNGGKVDTILNVEEEGMTPERLKENEEKIKEKMAESGQTGVPTLFSGKISSVQLGKTPQELDNLKTKRVLLEDVAIMTGVPASMLSSYADTKYNNAEQATINFLREYILPQHQGLTTFLNRKLLPEDKELNSVDPTPSNVQRKIEIFNSAAENKAITPNEMREYLNKLDTDFELEEIEGGDELPAAEQSPMGLSYQKKNVLEDKERRDEYGWKKNATLDRQEDEFKRTVIEFFKDQKQRVLEKMGEKSIKSVSDYFSVTDENEKAVLAFLPELKRMAKEGGDETAEDLNLPSKLEMDANLESSLRSRADLLAKSINQTTFEALQEDFKEAMESNNPREQMKEKIEERYEGISKGRAGVIAATETHHANMRGTFEAYNQAGAETKIWTAVADSATRPAHAVADGQKRAMNEPFNVGGESIMFPGQGSPSNAINCRCVI